MSLHALATNMASKGRNGDSMLVHMTPGEVHGLQALAMKHGGSLTINPDTGLPEANFLKSLLPIIAGFALGPAGFGLMSAGMAGLTVGGVTALATGSLQKGLMAGLGAYGGAGLGGGLSELGAGELAQRGIAESMPTLAEGATQTQIADYAKQVNDLRAVGLESASKLPIADRLSAGFSSATASPMDAFNFAKDNKMALGMAAAPIMADMMVPTTTKSAPIQSPGRIVEKRWNGREFVPVASTDAGVFNTSGRTFSDPYRGYNDGGIVALAGGGNYTTLTKDSSADDIASAYKQFTTASGGDTAANQKAAVDYLTNLGIGQDKIGQAYGTYQASPTYNAYTDEQIGSYLTTNPNVDLNTAISTTNANPADVNRYISNIAAPFVGSTDTTGGSGTLGIYNQMNALGIDANELYNARIAADPKYAGWSQADIARGYSLDKGALALAAADKDGVSDKEWAKFMDDNKYSVNDMAQAFGLSKNEVQRRYDAAKKEEKKTTLTCPAGYQPNAAGTACVPIGVTEVFNPPTVPSGYHLENGVLVKNISATQNTTTNVANPTDLYTAPASSLAVGVGGNTGPSQIGGGATVNPNGTITTSPRIPGIPVGGFTGITSLRDAYTKGGGSLGYTSPKFDKIEDFNAKYVDKRLTGDSKAAYDYLTGKAGAKYPTKSGVGQISEDYATAVLGYPARGNLPYIYNKETGKMDVNPDYVAPGRDSAGNVTYSMSLNDIKKSLTDTPMSGQALYDWAMTNNLSAQQIADATGRSLSSVYSDFRAGSKAAAKKKEDDKAAGINTLVDNSGAGSSDSGGGPGGTGPGGVGGAGGPGSTTASESIGPAADSGDDGDSDAKGGYYSRGKLNYRAKNMAMGGATGYALGGLGTLGGYSDGGRLLKGPGDGVSDSIPATIGRKQQPARLADGEFVVPARIVSELGNGSTDAGAKKLYAMLDRVQRARGKTTGKNKVAANSRADKYLPA